MGQWLVSSCLGEFAPALRKKAWRPSKKLSFLVAGRHVLLQTNHGPCRGPQNVILEDMDLLVHPLLLAPAAERGFHQDKSCFSKSSPVFPCQGVCSGAGCWGLLLFSFAMFITSITEWAGSLQILPGPFSHSGLLHPQARQSPLVEFGTNAG